VQFDGCSQYLVFELCFPLYLAILQTHNTPHNTLRLSASPEPQLIRILGKLRQNILFPARKSSKFPSKRIFCRCLILGPGAGGPHHKISRIDSASYSSPPHTSLEAHSSGFGYHTLSCFSSRRIFTCSTTLSLVFWGMIEFTRLNPVLTLINYYYHTRLVPYTQANVPSCPYPKIKIKFFNDHSSDGFIEKRRVKLDDWMKVSY